MMPGIMDRNQNGYEPASSGLPCLPLLDRDGRICKLLTLYVASILGIFWKCARVGERLSPYVSLCCIAMAVSILLFANTLLRSLGLINMCLD